MSFKQRIGEALGPLKPLAIWSVSNLRLARRGASSDIQVDVVSRSPELDLGEGIHISHGSQLGGGSITLRDNVEVGSECVLRGDVTIREGTNLVSKNRIIGDIDIGRYCAFATGASIQQKNHSMTHPSIQGSFYTNHDLPHLGTEGKPPVEIGNDVWLGLNATVTADVTVGDGAIIGTDALVTKDVRPYEIVGGNPAEHIGWRFDEAVREYLLDLQWWEWTSERISENEGFFTSDLSEMDVDEIQKLVV